MSSVADLGARRLSAVADQASSLVNRAADAATQAAARPASKALEVARSYAPVQPPQIPAEGVSAANKLLRQLGINAFTPTLGFSTDLTLPIGVGGAVAGPYTPGVGNLSVAGFSLNAVRRGEILCGFVPVGGIFADFGDKSGIHVAWLNLNTLRGGFDTPLGGLIDTVLDAVVSHAKAAPIPATAYSTPVSALKRALAVIPSNGVRGGVVETGPGLVLCAIYGTVKRGGTTYVFFPSFGLTEAH
ncbi:hypothetical protein [Gordonia sp. FQ]|uniref:hypothetical protein n=1 Tax=Gordonia sp. FQ TaxID=3446634 RepID=UPI003F829508